MLALFVQTGQDTRFARSGQSVDREPAEFSGQLREAGEHPPAPGLVSALEEGSAPADGGEDHGEALRALPAPPAIDERPVVARLVGEVFREVSRDVGGDEGRAGTFRLEAADLPVVGAHFRPFVITECRQVDRPGNVVFGELRGTADVDDLVEGGEIDGQSGGGGLLHGWFADDLRLRHVPPCSPRGAMFFSRASEISLPSTRIWCFLAGRWDIRNSRSIQIT